MFAFIMQRNGMTGDIRVNMSLGQLVGLETQKTFWPADTNRIKVIDIRR